MTLVGVSFDREKKKGNALTALVGSPYFLSEPDKC